MKMPTHLIPISPFSASLPLDSPIILVYCDPPSFNQISESQYTPNLGSCRSCVSNLCEREEQKSAKRTDGRGELAVFAREGTKK